MFIIITLVFLAAAGYAAWRGLSGYFQQWRAQRHARQHADKPLKSEVLAYAEQEADAVGLGVEFRAYVCGILQQTGAEQIQVGHLLWIFDQLEQGKRFDPTQPVPRFTKV